MIEYILSRAKEPSTWAGIAGIVAGITGYHLSPDLNQSIASLGVAVASLVAVILKESGSHK